MAGCVVGSRGAERCAERGEYAAAEILFTLVAGKLLIVFLYILLVGIWLDRFL